MDSVVMDAGRDVEIERLRARLAEVTHERDAYLIAACAGVCGLEFFGVGLADLMDCLDAACPGGGPSPWVVSVVRMAAGLEAPDAAEPT